jgi:SAM-dependent methyltransferase
MPEASATYVFGGDAAELQRLTVQAAGLAPQAQWLFDQIPIRAGWRTVDIGCGPIGILDLLSERVGPQGLVVGLEREARFFAMAGAEVKRRGLGNVRIVAGDALNPDLQEGSFDFVHERLVLMNMPQAQQRKMVSQMLALLKPGGSIALQDYDRVSCVCYPEHPSWVILLAAYADAFSAGGGNGSTGRVLPWLLRSAGARNVKTKIHASFLDVGDSRRTHHLGLLAVMEDKILALGRFGRGEFADHKQALLEHLAHPDTLLIDHLLVQAWGEAG